MPLYPAIPTDPPIPAGAATPVANFYADLANLIADENPYGQNIIAQAIFEPFGLGAPVRAQRVNALAALGVRIMGWLRASWSTNPFLSCNHQMSVSEKQQSYHWTTLHPEDPTPQFPSVNNPPAASVHPPGGSQNSADVELHQVCKALYVPFQYQAADGRTLDAAILIGYVGSGGGH